MIVVTVCFGFDQRRSASLTGALNSLNSGFMHGNDIHAVHDDSWHAVSSSAIHDVSNSHGLVTWSEFAILIVFTGEDNGQM